MRAGLSSSKLEQSPSLTSVLTKRLRMQIDSNALSVGERFPTDAEISEAFGVSRTVVREAVSALREEGLISTQRGRGSIVAARSPARPFGISPKELESLDDVIRVLELRTALEVEAAGLAASRRTAADIAQIAQRLTEFDAAISKGEDGIEADIEFHLAIAAATHNDHFRRLLGTFRTIYVARRRVRGGLETPALLQSYLKAVQREHRQIEKAIVQGNVAAARREMRRHLLGKRYRELHKRINDNNPA